tara:strand:- start:1806 stop:2936 length:1131 start_codon:yes stop_codon:yes gene_type:complete
MIKVFYWAPFISKIATPLAVINSAIAIKKYSKGAMEPFIINLFNEWENYSQNLKDNQLLLINLFKIKLNFIFSDKGFLMSRISFLCISILSFFPLLRLLKNKKPDYLIIHLNTSLPLILLYLFNFKTKFILRISGKPRLNIFRKFLWKITSNKIYKVTTPTKLIAKELIKNKIFSDKKIEVLFDPIITLNKYNGVKKELDNNKKIVAIGRLTKQKNFSFLIDCFSHIHSSNPNLTLHILGEGEQRKELSELVKKKNLNDKIFLHGHRLNINDYLKDSLCFVLSSLWEDPGFVVIEAAMNNTIIISSNCETGPKELLNDKINSFVYEVNNKESFIKSFESFLKTDKSQKLKMKINMKKDIKKFTIFSHYQNIKKIIL